MTALSIRNMNFSMREMDRVQREQYAALNATRQNKPKDPMDVECYWAIYRKAARTTKKNGGWVFVNFIHASVRKMQVLMESKGWYLPEMRVELSQVLGAVDADKREQVEERAEAVCHPDYSLYMTSAFRGFLEQFDEVG